MDSNDNKPIIPDKNSLAVWLVGGLALLVAAIGAFYFVVRDRMDAMPMYFVLFAIIILAIIGLGLAFIKKTKKGEIPAKDPDYRVFFIIGVTWIPLGIATENPGFIGAGVLFMILGLANKDKWQEQTKWKDMPKSMRQMKLALVTLLGVMVLLGVLFYFFRASGNG
jgi:hypothetical protein